MRRAFQRFMRWWGLWLLTGIVGSVILLVIAATLPPGDGFLYPLRRLFFTIRPVAYWSTVIIVTATCAYAIPFMVSRGISPLDPETYQPIMPDMRAFTALLAVSILAYGVMSRHNFALVPLEQIRTGSHTYLLIMEEDAYFRDRFLLYQCDTRTILCEEIFRIRGPRYELSPRLIQRDVRILVQENERTLFEVNPLP